MAKFRAPQPKQSALQLSGSEEVSGIYADVFVVAAEKETNMFNLFFFQSQTPITGLEDYGTVQLAKRRRAKCVAHLVLTEKAVDVLFKAIADNRGIVIPTQSEGQE